jgi:hypothetical protein
MRPRDPEAEPGVGNGAEPPTVPFKAQRPDEPAPERPAPVTDAAEPTSGAVETTTTPPTSGRRDKVLAAVVGLAVVVIAVVLLSRVVPLPFGAPEPDAPVAAGESGTLVINALPWARLVEIRTAAGDEVAHDGGVTPLVLSLEPGKYELVLRHDELGERTVPVSVSAGETSAEKVVLGDLDPTELLGSLGLGE